MLRSFSGFFSPKIPSLKTRCEMLSDNIYKLNNDLKPVIDSAQPDLNELIKKLKNLAIELTKTTEIAAEIDALQHTARRKYKQSSQMPSYIKLTTYGHTAEKNFISGLNLLIRQVNDIPDLASQPIKNELDKLGKAFNLQSWDDLVSMVKSAKEEKQTGMSPTRSRGES